MAESLPRRKSSLLKVQLGGLFLRDLATKGTIFPLLVFPNPVGEKTPISYYVGWIIVYENSYTPKLKTFLIPERENKSLEEKFPLVEFTFSLSKYHLKNSSFFTLYACDFNLSVIFVEKKIICWFLEQSALLLNQWLFFSIQLYDPS